MFLKQEALLCLLAILEFPLSAPYNDHLEWGEQVSNPHFTKLDGLQKKKVPYRIKACIHCSLPSDSKPENIHFPLSTYSHFQNDGKV